MKLYRLTEKIKYCKEHGHKKIKSSVYLSAHYGASGQGNLTAWEWCSRCGQIYDRLPNSSEIAEWDKMLKTEITI
jgi:hypothetical protein